MNGEDLGRLIEEFGKTPRIPTPEQTFMEIAGYPHYENVASNILAFFLYPGNNHGIHTTVLESLLSSVGMAASDSMEISDVTREAGTASGKRLDLLVRTESLVAGIENKIFAEVYNDLDDYANFVHQETEAGRQSACILLCLRKPGGDQDLHGFQPVTYERFFDELLNRLGPILPAANPRYVGYLLDFIRTIQNLVRRPGVSDNIREFITKNSEKLAALEAEMQRFRQEMSDKVFELSNLVDVSCAPNLYDVIPARTYGGEWAGRLALCRYYDVKVPNQRPVAVDVYITPAGWRIVAFRRPDGTIGDLLVAKGLSSTPDDWYPNRRLCFSFPYDADLIEVKDKLQGLINALRTPEQAL